MSSLAIFIYTFNSIISSLQNYTVLGIYINTLNIGYDFRCWMMRSLIDCTIIFHSLLCPGNISYYVQLTGHNGNSMESEALHATLVLLLRWLAS